MTNPFFPPHLTNFEQNIAFNIGSANTSTKAKENELIAQNDALEKKLAAIEKWKCEIGFHNLIDKFNGRICKTCLKQFESRANCNCTWNLLHDGKIICNKCESVLVSSNLPTLEELLNKEDEIKCLFE